QDLGKSPVCQHMPALGLVLLGGLLNAGCIGMPLSAHNDREPTAHQLEALDTRDAPKAVAARSFSHNGRRLFPEPGWWCQDFDAWLSPGRADKGYTIILPGVEGTSCYNIAIARGLVQSGHPAAIEVRDWTTGFAPLWPYHLIGIDRNRRQAQEIAAQI